MSSARWAMSDHHVPCSGGCGELSDECACRKPNPLGSMTIVPAIGSRTEPLDLWGIQTTSSGGFPKAKKSGDVLRGSRHATDPEDPS